MSRKNNFVLGEPEILGSQIRELKQGETLTGVFLGFQMVKSKNIKNPSPLLHFLDVEIDKDKNNLSLLNSVSKIWGRTGIMRDFIAKNVQVGDVISITLSDIVQKGKRTFYNYYNIRYKCDIDKSVYQPYSIGLETDLSKLNR